MAINSYPDNSGGEVNFPDQLIDPVSKFRVSNPENLIDTDFEYGLQPTKWETVELINNTPSFFSKSGDTTIDGISSIITNAGTREIIVKTELDHGLAVGIPINVTGTKSITADGAYIINSIPDTKTFTYLCKDNQTDTNSILDLYSSIITGEFFQGSQLRISDSDGIVTDAEGTSILTVTTNTTHGFGENTPFYFLNLNSTVAQEFQAANTASKSFDASNSATAQTFDGSNSLSSVNIDWSNSATFGGTPSTISGTNQAADTITVTHQAGENFNNLPLGTPLYYAVSATGGYFNTNPRGVVFLKTINQLGTSTSTFQVSLVPDGDVIDLTSNLTGTFQIANQARTFAGNNINPLTQTVIDVEVGTEFSFDGGNQGYTGPVQGTPPNNTITVLSYTGTAINGDGSASADYYVGAMVLYSSTGTAATGLTNNTTYFVTSVTNNGGGNYTFSVAALPGGTPISITTGTGSGTQTFSRIGVSLDKDIVHIPNANFQVDDMIQYTFPADGRFGVETEEEEKLFYFIDTAYDAHNYKLGEDIGFKPLVATGGTILPEYTSQGRTWKAHQFTTVGTSSFVVTDAGKDCPVEYLIIAGGGGAGSTHGGGGGAGGYRSSISGDLSGGTLLPEASIELTAQTYSIVVGAGGTGHPGGSNNAGRGSSGGNSSAFGIVAIGGGGGGAGYNADIGIQTGLAGGSSGGGGADQAATNTEPRNPGSRSTSPVQGFSGGIGFGNSVSSGTTGGGGGGAGETGGNGDTGTPLGRRGKGGDGLLSFATGSAVARAGGGGGGGWDNGFNTSGGLGGGGLGFSSGPGTSGASNTGSGGGSGGGGWGAGGNGGSGVVIVRYPITPPVEFVPGSATGGVTSEVLEAGVLYRAHTFTNVGTSTFTVQNVGSWNEFEYMIIAGGGGGGALGGGGGAGGYRAGFASLSATNYSIVVGQGGVGADGGGQGQDGTSSSAFGISTVGGGGAGSHTSNRTSTPGRLGGSGGGGGDNGDLYPAGAGTAGQGFAGGIGIFNIPATQRIGGGGGGAGGVGAPGSLGGHGGIGVRNSILGPAFYWAAGGGAGGYTDSTGGNGGIGGGGGGTVNSGTPGQPGAGAWKNATGGTTGFDRDGGIAAANTGSGGGGNSWSNPPNARTGAAGIVVVRYPIAIPQPGEYITASGGEVSVVNDTGIKYAVHQFKNVGTESFNVIETSSTPSNNSIQYFIVAGGGGGGAHVGGGGGAGGILTGTTTVTATNYNVVVGDGAVSRTGGNLRGASGQNSSAFGFTAIGGGGGGTIITPESTDGIAGGSGGGAGGGNNGSSQLGSGTGGAGTAGQGFKGGNVNLSRPSDNTSAAGGGGAGGAATDRLPNSSTTDRRDGGPGISINWTGSTVFFGGGGGSGSYNAVTAGNGGAGGGGGGTSFAGTAGLGDTQSLNPAGNGSTGNNIVAGNGAPNSGGGGGGAGGGSGGAATSRGGSGIVIIRYPIGVAT
jgi:hypothetical protein